MTSIFLWAIILWNLFVFVIFGIDKYKAIKNRWRISEKFLMTCALFMGGIGATLGMEVFRHKTKKLLFKVGVPFAILINCVIVILVLERV